MLIPVVATLEAVAISVSVAVETATVAATVAAAITVAATVAVKSAAATAAVETTAAAAAVKPAAITAATVETAATAAIFPRFGLFYYDGVAIQFCFVQGIDGCSCLIVVRHFYKRKATGTAGLVVSDDFSYIHYTISFKSGAQIVAVGLEIQLCYKNVHYKKN